VAIAYAEKQAGAKDSSTLRKIATVVFKLANALTVEQSGIITALHF
jgi:hypothetical protein